MLNKDELVSQLGNIIDVDTIQGVTVSNPIKKNTELGTKIKIVPVLVKNKKSFQFSKYVGEKVFHNNCDLENFFNVLVDEMETNFKQCEIVANNRLTILMNKKKQFTLTGVKENLNVNTKAVSHNKAKQYILPDGQYVDWMYKLGLMDKNGVVLAHRQKKFRQINKFLEMLRDVEKHIPENSTIVDMGCGKSYLTFATYYYFNVIKNKNVKIDGYDLKKDVVEYCNSLSEKFGFDNLKFYCKDIAEIGNDDNKISMIITLHACDTATDYAIYHGIRWNCNVIINVPCCQHELFHQMKNSAFPIITEHGILKERFAAMLTDSIRSRILNLVGYKSEIMEFIEVENTPKNLMICSIKNNKPMDNNKKRELDEIIEQYGISPTLYNLIFKQ